MARCRCAGDACSCVLAAGPGIRVAGTGAPGSQWVISSDPDATGTVTVKDTATLDLAAEGAGTIYDPFVLSGSVDIGPLLQVIDSSEIDFTLTGTGTEADPYRLTADLTRISTIDAAPTGWVLARRADGKYVPTAPTTATPGAITIGTGLIGDGSTTAPLNVDICTYAELKSACASP